MCVFFPLSCLPLSCLPLSSLFFLSSLPSSPWSPSSLLLSLLQQVGNLVASAAPAGEGSKKTFLKNDKKDSRFTNAHAWPFGGKSARGGFGRRARMQLPL